MGRVAVRSRRARAARRALRLAGRGAAAAPWYGADSLRHRRESGHGYDLRGELDVRSDRFLYAAEALTGAPISWGSDVELLINGDQIFPRYLETIREAQHSVCLLTYVYWRGDIADEVADALCERARAGVECNVLIDAVGGMKLERELIERMEEAGVRVVRFRPVKPYALKRVGNRTHRKILVADGRIGLTGGVGIAEEWTGDAQDPDHWRDTHVRVCGPVVRGLFGAFAENWLEATGEVLAGEHHLPDIEQREDGGPMMVVRSSAGVGDSNVEALYYLAIAAARETLDLTAAYFVPRPGVHRGAAVDCAERGVRTRVLVPGANIDKPPVWIAGRAAYDDLVAGGVEVYEYQPTMLHAKTMTRRRLLVGGRLGELRQPLLPAQRRGDALRLLHRLRGAAHGAVRARPGGLRPHRAGPLERPRPRSSARRRRRSASPAASSEPAPRALAPPEAATARELEQQVPHVRSPRSGRGRAPGRSTAAPARRRARRAAGRASRARTTGRAARPSSSSGSPASCARASRPPSAWRACPPGRRRARPGRSRACGGSPRCARSRAPARRRASSSR